MRGGTVPGECPSRVLLVHVEQTCGPVPVTLRQINRLRAEWDMSRDKGRPRDSEAVSDSGCGELIRVIPSLGFAGVHIFADWAGQQDIFSGVVTLLPQAVGVWQTDHPDDSSPLLCHRQETLMPRFKALFYAPLLGIGKLTEFDVREHPLETLIGRGYQSSTLNQAGAYRCGRGADARSDPGGQRKPVPC